MKGLDVDQETLLLWLLFLIWVHNLNGVVNVNTVRSSFFFLKSCLVLFIQSYIFCIPCRSLFSEVFPTFTGEGFDQVLHHTGQCKSTGGCYVQRTGGGYFPHWCWRKR